MLGLGMPIEHKIEPYAVMFVVPAVAVLMGMVWYKLTSRRNRPFEPTLWFVFRWGYILLVLSAPVWANLDRLIALHRSQPALFLVGTVAALFVVFDWRRAVRKERRQLEQRQMP
jgi:hypothetical protein